MGQKRVSRHLAHLRMRGLVRDRREGQHIWYTPAPGLVRYEIHGDRYALTLTHPSGVGVTMFGPVAGTMAAPQAADIARP